MASSRKRSAITLSISAQEKAQLEQLALAFGQTWGEKPNVSKLIKAIAQNHLRIAPNHDWSSDRINTLNKALNLLKDKGHFSEAKAIATLLLERSEPSPPLRQEIQSWLENPGIPWRAQVENYIQRDQPFRLTYQDATDTIWSFTVRRAEIVRHEEREYLDCWCTRTEGNHDIEALRHNWTFRLDRIPEEAAISPAEGDWLSELSYVRVEFHLLNRLALSYRPKSDADIINEWIPEQKLRKVVRKVRNTFWFFREVKRYGADCIVVGPQEVRDRFVEELERTVQNYRQPES